MTYLTLNLDVFGIMNDEQLLAFCIDNKELKIEREPNGKITVMPPTGLETSNHNSELNAEFVYWNRRARLGLVFDSNGGFLLPNTAMRAPDVAWLEKSRWEALDAKSRKGFAPICPDFVLELLSASDNPAKTREKMGEWIENGCRMAWLVIPSEKTTLVYRQGEDIMAVPFSETLEGCEVLPGFSLKMEDIFGV